MYVVCYLRKVMPFSPIHVINLSSSQLGKSNQAISSVLFLLMLRVRNSSLIGTPLLYPICYKLQLTSTSLLL